MEGRQLEEVIAAAHHAIYKPADGITGRIEYDEEYHDAEYIEEHMGEGGTASLCVGGQRSHKRRDGRTNVLSHRQCCCLLKAEARDVHTEEHQRNGHGGC